MTKTLLLTAALTGVLGGALALPAVAQVAMTPDPTVFTCNDWVLADETTKKAFLTNTVAYANDAANAPNTAELQATIIDKSEAEAMLLIDARCDDLSRDMVIIDLLKTN